MPLKTIIATRLRLNAAARLRLLSSATCAATRPFSVYAAPVAWLYGSGRA